jgi:HSP20 family molecular chaperone IbpA
MTTLAIRRRRPPELIFGTAHSTLSIDAQAPFQGGIDGTFAPAFEVREYGDHFEFQVDVPGVRPPDLAVFIAGGWVTVAGRRIQPPDPKDCARYVTHERAFGSFWRAFHLSPPVATSGARADLSDGVLLLSVPKASGDRGTAN